MNTEKVQKVRLRINARPQFLPYLTRTERWAAIVAHRRAGKTVGCIQDLISRAAKCDKPEGRFAYIAPTYTQAKDVAWNYLKQYTTSIPTTDDPRESDLSVTFRHNGARIRLYGAENYDRLRGLYLDGAVLDEAGDIDPRAWPEVIRPTLSDRKGWATFIGTSKGRNAFAKIIEHSRESDDWFSLTLKASQTGILSDDELRDARSTMTAEQYAQEYECDFHAAIRGAYYAKEIALAEDQGRIGKPVPYEPLADTFAGWDLGIADSTAIWIGQRVNKETRIIAYCEANDQKLEYFVDWVNRLPYQVDRHYLPHDAAARELQTGNSRLEFLEARGLRCEVLPRGKVEDRINAVTLALPQCWFDHSIGYGLDYLRSYRSEYVGKRDTFKPVPFHDRASDSADAFGILIQGMNSVKSDNADAEYYAIETDWVV